MFFFFISVNKTIKIVIYLFVLLLFIIFLSIKNVYAQKRVVYNFFNQNKITKNLPSKSANSFSIKKNQNNSLKSSKYLFSSLTGMPTLSNGDAALPSNANNFHGFVNASVNPRTGSASFAMKIGTILFDNTQNKRSLVLSYGGGITAYGPDIFGLGSHWTWNIGIEKSSATEINGHKSTDIYIGDGHSFTMISDIAKNGKSYWHPLRHKLKDVLITGAPNDWYISLVSGIRVHLKNGYEDWEESRDGKRIWFYYDNNKKQHLRRLIYICAHPLTEKNIQSKNNFCSRDGIHFLYANNTILVQGQKLIKINLLKSNGFIKINSIIASSLSSANIIASQKTSIINFTYDDAGNKPWLLHSVHYPTGSSVKFLYNEESGRQSARTPGLLTGFNGRIPVVTEQVTHTDDNSTPDKHLWFYYGDAYKYDHNYLGYLKGHVLIPGKDNLFDVADNYTYKVTVDNGLTRTTTTYNKFHLPLSVMQISDTTNKTLVANYLKYPNWKNTTFKQLPSNYSFLLGDVKKIYTTSDENDFKSTNVNQQFLYNDQGQLYWKKDSFGRETFIQYCPAKGNKNCPVKNEDWPSGSYPEKILYTPAIANTKEKYNIFDTNNKASKAIEVSFNYSRLPVFSKKITMNFKNKTNQKPILVQRGSFWQVKYKIEGMVDLSSLKKIKPGDSLPDIPANSVSTKTNYSYADDPLKWGYGQTNGIEVIKKAQHLPIKIYGKLLEDTDLNSDNENISRLNFKIDNSIDTTGKMRHLTMYVQKNKYNKNYKNNSFSSQSLSQQYIKSATATYSLSTGLKYSAVDAMKTVKNQWFYDNWNRPIKQIITPLSTGEAHVITWSYLYTNKEKAIIKTNPDGNQEKTVIGADGNVLSKWHRFKDQSKNSILGFKYWIPDSEFSYTSTGKIASVKSWNAADSINNNEGKAVSSTITFGYDELNRQIWSKDQYGKVVVSVTNDSKLQKIKYTAVEEPHKKKNILGAFFEVTKANILGKPVATYLFSTDFNIKKNGKPLYSNELANFLKNLKYSIKPTSSLQTLKAQGLIKLSGKKGLFRFIQKAIEQKSWYTANFYEYDNYGRNIKKIAGNGNTEKFVWQNGNLVATIFPNGHIVHDEYNLMGNKISRCIQTTKTDVCHNLGKRQFDTSENLIWQRDELGNIIRLIYDQNDRLIKKIVPGSDGVHTYTYSYNSFGLTKVELDGKILLKKIYDPVTWDLKEKEDNFSHFYYQYDKNSGFLTSMTKTTIAVSESINSRMSGNFINYPSSEIKVLYNRYGQPIQVTNSVGNTFVDMHDSEGRVILSKVKLCGQKNYKIFKTLTYDIFNRLKSSTNGLNIKREFEYDSIGSLKSTTDTDSSGKIYLRLSYTYDGDTNNITTVTREEYKKKATQFYKYDNVNNLTFMKCVGKGDNGYSLCPRDPVITGSGLLVSPIITSQSFDFDKWNNITKVTETLRTSVKSNKKFLKKTDIYTYSGNSNNSNSSKFYDPHKLISYDTKWQNDSLSRIPHVLKYDNLGRVIVDGDGNKIKYNARGLQSSFTNHTTGKTTYYTYDSDNHQVVEQTYSSKGFPVEEPIYIIYSGNERVGYCQKDKFGKNHKINQILDARSVDGKLTNWYLYSHKGDVLNILDSHKNIVADNIYSPYGLKYNLLDDKEKIILERGIYYDQSSLQEKFQPGFDNQASDPVTGYQFLGGGYRAYNPIIRRFMSKDSLSPFSVIDGYGFGLNNPIMNIDPSGHFSEGSTFLSIIGISASIGLSLLLPIAAGGLATGSAALAFSFAGGMFIAASGVASGSLQIISNAYPGNKKLKISSESFGIANSILTLATGAVSAPLGFSLINVAKNLMEKASGGLIISSSLSAAASGVTGIISSGLNIGLVNNPNLATQTGYKPALATFNILTSILNVTSMATAFGASVAKAYDFTNQIFENIKTNLNNEANSNAHISETHAIHESTPIASDGMSIDNFIDSSSDKRTSFATSLGLPESKQEDLDYATVKNIQRQFQRSRSSFVSESAFFHSDARGAKLKINIASIPGMTFTGPMAEYNGTGLTVKEVKTLLLLLDPIAKKYKYAPNVQITWYIPDALPPRVSNGFGMVPRGDVVNEYNRSVYELEWVRPID